MMVEARKDNDKEPVADHAASDMSRFADVSAKLFAEQASAMAVMTAYGMTVAAQMTGMMLGAFRGPASAESSQAPERAERTPAPTEPKPSAKVVPLRPEVPKTTETKTAPAARVAVKSTPKAPKPVKAKAAPAKASAAKPARRAVAAKAADSPMPASANGDDLKKISGIGPRLEQELNARGIIRYSDVAALSKAAMRKLDGELGLEGRIIKDDWAGQAEALSGGEG